MMLTLRGLPPDIEVAHIRSFIHERCAVGRVLLDELAAEAGGTRVVTVATMNDADAVTLRQALSGEQLGAYTLRVEPYRSPDASGINFLEKGGPGDHGGYKKKASVGSVAFGGNSDLKFGHSGGRGESSGRGGHLGNNSERDGGRFGGFAGSYRRDGDLGGLRESNGRDYGGNYVEDVDSLGGHGGSYGRDDGRSKWRGEIGGLSGFGRNDMRDGVGVGSVGRDIGKKYGCHGNFGGYGGQFQERENNGSGKRYRGEDSINESSSKRWRDSSERDASFGSGGGVTFDGSSGRGRGGYSGPDNSRGGGMVGYTDARSSRDAGVFGGYSHDREPGSFGGGSALRRSAMGEHSPHSNDNRKAPAWEQNHAPDSVQSFGKGSGLSSGTAPPWLADRMQVAIEGSRERSRSPAREVSPRRDSARGSQRGRGGVPLGRRPRSRSPFPPFRGAQPAAGNQREPPFKPPVMDPWADTEPVPESMGLGAHQTPFPINPLQQFGFGYQQMQPLFEPSVELMGTGPQHGHSIRNFENSSLNKIQSQSKTRPATNKPFLGNTQPTKVQTSSRKPERPRELDPKSDSIYELKASYILSRMLDLDKINPSNRSIATLFENRLKSRIKDRLRELTHDFPFKRDLPSIYRHTYSLATDDETMKSVCKELSLTEIPIPRKVYPRNLYIFEKARKLELALKTDFTDLTKYVNPNIKVDADSKKTIEDNVKAENFCISTALIIASNLLKPDEKTHKSPLQPEELRLRPYLQDVICAELAKLPQEEGFWCQDVNGLIRLYHERTDPDRNRHLIDVAIEKLNAKEVKPYTGKFTIPEKAAMTMEFWPDLYLKPGEARPTSVNVPESKKEALIDMWMEYACTAIASDVFVRCKAEYLKYKADMCVDDMQHRVRLWLRMRINKLVPRDTSRIVSTHSLIALYRHTYPPETDKELAKGAIKERLRDAAKIRVFRKTTTVTRLMVSAASKLASEAAYGRQISRDERALLTQSQNELLSEMQKVIRQRMLKIANQRNARIPTEDYLLIEYRKKFPKKTDRALLQSAINEIEMSAAEARQQANEASDLEGSKVHQDPRSSHVAKSDEVTVSRLEGWRETCACQVADEALHGRVMNRREREELSLDDQEKLKAVRAMVRDQLKGIIARNKGALTMFKDLLLLYRERHPPEEDLALKERVMGMSLAALRELNGGVENPDEITASTMGAWRDSVVSQVADEALFGEVVVSAERKVLSQEAQAKIKLAREIVREQLQEILAGEHYEVLCRRDLMQLYRQVHRMEEDVALKACVMRGGSHKELVKNAAVCPRNGKDVKRDKGAPGDPIESIDLTADPVVVDTIIEIEDDDEMNPTNTDNIEDIELNDADLEDY